MDTRKQMNKITMDINMLILIISIIIIVLTIVISILLRHYKSDMYFISDMISAGLFGIIIGHIILLIIGKNVKEKEACEYLNMSCKY